jgi:hypothetical protein
VAVSGVLRDIIETTLMPLQDIEVILSVPGGPPPDVVVLGLKETERPETVEVLLGRYPNARVLGIAGDGRQAYMHELRPHRVALGELSPDQLIEAIRHVGLSAGAWTFE